MPWFTSVENTRLAYFSELARRIQKGYNKYLDEDGKFQVKKCPRKKRRQVANWGKPPKKQSPHVTRDHELVSGLVHFKDPTAAIESWTKRKVDKYSKEYSGNRSETFTRYFKSEMESAKLKVKAAKTVKEIRKLERYYFQKSRLQRAEIRINNSMIDSKDNFHLFQTQVLEILEQMNVEYALVSSPF